LVENVVRVDFRQPSRVKCNKETKTWASAWYEYLDVLWKLQREGLLDLSSTHEGKPREFIGRP